MNILDEGCPNPRSVNAFELAHQHSILFLTIIIIISLNIIVYFI